MKTQPKHIHLKTQSSQLVHRQSRFRTFKYTKRVLNSTGALALEEVPSSIVVIGGGYIGIELGGALCKLWH